MWLILLHLFASAVVGSAAVGLASGVSGEGVDREDVKGIEIVLILLAGSLGLWLGLGCAYLLDTVFDIHGELRVLISLLVFFIVGIFLSSIRKCYSCRRL
jgi:hypothetical protein